MLRACTHQAAGLLALRDVQSTRILAVVQHGDEQAELPFLWRLCLACTALGHSVTVLDATISESDQLPGLLQRLGQEAVTATQVNAWAVLPAKEGLAQLSFSGTSHQRGWHQLIQCFAGSGVVILYCNAQCVATTLKGLDAPVLLPVSRKRASLLTSYLALKRLLIVGGQRPTIINVTPPETEHDSTDIPAICSSLVECARNFLNFEARVIAFTDTSDDEATDEFNRLTLKLLDAAGQQGSVPALAAQGLLAQSPRDGSTPTHMRTADVHR